MIIRSHGTSGEQDESGEPATAEKKFSHDSVSMRLLEIPRLFHEKEKQGENLNQSAAHVPQPGKKTPREKPHGAHVESEAEEAGGISSDTKD